MNEAMANLLGVLQLEAAIGAVLGVLLLLAWLLEKWCFSRSRYAGGNQLLYEYWANWDDRVQKVGNWLVFLFLWAIGALALTAAAFAALTVWFPPAWE